MRGARRQLARVALALSIAVAAALALGHRLGGWDFVKQHVGPLVVAALVVGSLAWVVIGLVAGTARGAILAVRRPRALGQSGAAYAEFVIVVIPFLLMFFGLMQMALASMARVLVSYSAFTAARAAIVIVPMEPAEVSSLKGAASSTINDEQPNKIGYGADTRTDFAISKKASLIRNAAAYAMIPASPSIDVVVKDVMNNWSGYLANRLLKGLNPIDYLKGVLGDVAGVPSAMLDTLSDKIKEVVQGGLDSQAAKDRAKQTLDSFIDGMTTDPAMRDRLKNAAHGYIDKYQGSAESPTGKLGDWVKNQIGETLSGPLDKFKDQVQNALATSLGSSLGPIGGGMGRGNSVDRALDVGMGSGSDGAGGAIIRSLRKLVYAKMGTVVTLHGKDGAIKTKFEWNEPITARVTHLYYCQIPLANRFAGRPFYNLADTTVNDMATGPMKGLTIIGIPGYFLPMTAEHTLTNQGKP
jgi:hypothetical protein